LRAWPWSERLDSSERFSYTFGMEVDFTPEQESQLSQLAMHEGMNAEQLVKQAALRLLDEEKCFHAAVREGFASIDNGDFIEEDEMDARISQMLRS
jgi:predicted transcriptional regulator